LDPLNSDATKTSQVSSPAPAVFSAPAVRLHRRSIHARHSGWKWVIRFPPFPWSSAESTST